MPDGVDVEFGIDFRDVVDVTEIVKSIESVKGGVVLEAGAGAVNNGLDDNDIESVKVGIESEAGAGAVNDELVKDDIELETGTVASDFEKEAGMLVESTYVFDGLHFSR